MKDSRYLRLNVFMKGCSYNAICKRLQTRRLQAAKQAEGKATPSCGNPYKNSKINGGKEQVIETKTSLYHLAAVAALAMLDYEPKSDYNTVKIWVPDLVPEYGRPYFYAFDGYNLGEPQSDRKW